MFSCQVHNFTEEFYAPPVVMVTANHLYNSQNVYSIKPENNVLNTWIEVSGRYSSINLTIQLKCKRSGFCCHEPRYKPVITIGHKKYDASIEIGVHS